MLLQGLPAEKERIIVPGPAGFMPPSAAQLGVALPPSGVGIAYGHHLPEDIAIAEIARQMLTKPNASIFAGVPLHYTNRTRKRIRAGTNCCTAALCAEQGHEDAMLSVHDMDAAKLRRVAQIFKRVREQMGINLPTDGKNVRYTGLQSRVNGNETHIDPLVALKPGAPPAGVHMPSEGQMPH